MRSLQRLGLISVHNFTETLSSKSINRYRHHDARCYDKDGYDTKGGNKTIRIIADDVSERNGR